MPVLHGGSMVVVVVCGAGRGDRRRPQALPLRRLGGAVHVSEQADALEEDVHEPRPQHLRVLVVSTTPGAVLPLPPPLPGGGTQAGARALAGTGRGR